MQDSSWADRLKLIADDDRLVGSAEALPLRLLAERTGPRAGPRAGLSAAMTRRGLIPVYERGQLLVDLAVTQILGEEAISDFQVKAQLVNWLAVRAENRATASDQGFPGQLTSQSLLVDRPA